MATDEQLVSQLAEGNEDALQELLRRYDSALARFLHRHTGGQDVEDLFQETWMRVVRHAPRFDRTKRFSTWLFQIAVNLCRDRHRRRAPLLGDVVVTSDDRGRIDAALDAARLLAELPQEQREVVMLRYYSDLSEAETAAILQCPKGTVKSRLHHALARMAKVARQGGER
jgi:RNA polymerase sigma-70 factor (ECF subfamily)